ncbi:recombinase family protein [Citrobacter portucalensis]|uniref:recombinase family protein n=1 Tax=Citrobacter portucalensis TaxID=1639133 RepID=UPI00226B3AE6|nr:recombinase family protein [Citrobacter portucalensis]MCX9042836.1 recombinase family protein [Citrobacter portucalensis]
MCIALAYLRYSSLQMQGKGASISRQKEMVSKWVDDQKLLTGKNYDEVAYYIDRGKSAFDGTNIREGEFGKLIDEVKRGQFPEGTPIICESLDRLTRQGVQHIQQILTQLTDTGCIVYTLSDRQIITKQSLNTLGGIVTIVAVADRAREESETKSSRVSDSKLRNYKAALEGKKIMTKHLPGWIYINEATGKMCVDPDKKKVVEQVFKLRLEGHTFQNIANIMNDSGVPVLNASRGAKHWLPNSIRTLLMNKSVIGYSSPSKVNPLIEEIPGYFPRCISDTLFNDVQQSHVPAQRGKKSDKPKAEYPESVNLFKGLAVCKYCGGNVFPNGAKPGYWGRVRCMGHHNKTCEAPPFGRYNFEHRLVTGMFPLLKFFDSTKQEDPSAAILESPRII